MKKKILSFLLVFAFMISSALVTTQVKADPFNPPDFRCDNWSAGDNAFRTYVTRISNDPAPHYEVRDVYSNELLASGNTAAPYTALKVWIPANHNAHARVDDGNGNWQPWSDSITCHHSTGTYTITATCGAVNPITYLRTITLNWSPNYYVQATQLSSPGGGTVYGLHTNGSEGISPPDVYTYTVPAYSTFDAMIASFPYGWNYYHETVTCN